MKKFLIMVCFAISCFFVYTLNTNALTPTILKQAYYYHENANTTENQFCIVSTSNPTCSVPSSVTPSPWVTGTDLSFYTDIHDGEFSGTAVIYVVTRVGGLNVTFYNRNISVTAGIGTSEFPSKGQNITNFSYSNLNIENITDPIPGSTSGALYISKVSFSFKGETTLNGGYYVKLGVGNAGNSTGLFYQITGAADVGSYFVFTNGSEYGYNSFVSFTSGELTSEKLEELNKTQNQTNQKLDEVKNQQNQTNQKLDKTNQELGKLNDNLNDDNTSGASSEASEFFSGFETDTFGLTSIITAPLNLIGSITSSSCSPLGLEVPFVDSTLSLPCMTSIYERYFGDFLTVYQTITFGIIAYWVCIRIFALVKDFKNPDHDEIEVMDL